MMIVNLHVPLLTHIWSMIIYVWEGAHADWQSLSHYCTSMDQILATTVNFLIRKIISNCFGGVDRNRRRNLSFLEGSWRYRNPFVWFIVLIVKWTVFPETESRIFVVTGNIIPGHSNVQFFLTDLLKSVRRSFSGIFWA